MKRFIAFILMLIMISSASLAVVNFPDLKVHVLNDKGQYLTDKNGEYVYEDHWATTEIMKAANIGLIEGYPDGNFMPDANITRGEFIKIAMVLATNATFDFSIMPECEVTSWAGPYVSVAEMQNIVEKGKYTDKNITEPITRIEMICILSRIQINMKGISQYRDERSLYTDINSLTNEEKDLLVHAARYELIEGMLSTNEIKPHEELTRAEAAVALMRVY
ncbi:MAG: S-layer homology domain-containing protein [Clostridia bacterium]|nr:S-layer homology domain-containing protein [Clostridia bacterium]